jgi:type VI secretion system protein ImpB
MSKSYQNEIPKARINITLDIETHGARKKMELPMRLLVMGKFNEKADQANVASREKISINKHNFNKILNDFSPAIDFSIRNHLDHQQENMGVKLSFKHLHDFHPDYLTKQIPELQKLIAMRNLLKELKANLTDNKLLRKELENIIHQPELLSSLQQELSTESPETL